MSIVVVMLLKTKYKVRNIFNSIKFTINLQSFSIKSRNTFCKKDKYFSTIGKSLFKENGEKYN